MTTEIKLPEGKSKPGNTVLSEAEVRHLWNETGVDVMRKDSAIALKLILSTGQRTLEVLHAKRDEFDLEAGEWVIPFERRKVRYKAEHREPHVIPLCSLHVELLKELQGMTGRETCDYWPQKQQAMEQWCQYLETLVAGKNILPFRQDGAA